MISSELASSASLLFAEGHLPGVSVETTGPMRPSRRWPVSGVMRGVFPFTGRGPFTAGREWPGHGGLITRTEWFEGPGAIGQAQIGGGRSSCPAQIPRKGAPHGTVTAAPAAYA